MTYSDLFANVEPEGAGRGRFNYHLKLLREADLVEVDENLYRLTSRGEAATILLEEGLGAPKPQKRWKLSDTITGSFFGLAFIGFTALVAILMQAQTPRDLVTPILAVGPPFLVVLIVVHGLDGFLLSSPTKVSYFFGGAVTVYSLFVISILLSLFFQANPSLAADPDPNRLAWLYLTPFVVAWLWVFGREREWGIWRWFATRLRLV